MSSGECRAKASLDVGWAVALSITDICSHGNSRSPRWHIQHFRRCASAGTLSPNSSDHRASAQLTISLRCQPRIADNERHQPRDVAGVVDAAVMGAGELEAGKRDGLAEAEALLEPLLV